MGGGGGEKGRLACLGKVVRITNSARDKVTGSDRDRVVHGKERGLKFSLAGYSIDIIPWRTALATVSHPH